MAPAIGRGIGQSFAPAYPHFVTRGLVALYDFVQGANSQVLYDISGNGNDGQLGSTTGVDTNDPTWTSEGLSFDAVDDRVDAPYAAFNFQGDATGMVAFKPKTLKHQMPIFRHNPSGATNYNLETLNTGALRFEWHDGAFQNVISDVVLTAGTAADVSFRRKGTTLDFFHGTDSAGSRIVTAPTASANNFGIGWKTSNFNDIDVYLLAVYNVALTDTEMAQNHRAAQHLMSLRGITI
jgi:hypothetical protein